MSWQANSSIKHNGHAATAIAPAPEQQSTRPAPPTGHALRHALSRLRGRMLLIGTLAGASWGLVMATAACLALVWLDLVFELAPRVRLAAGGLAAICGGAALTLVLVRTWRAGRLMDLARRLDQAGGAGGQIVAGYDLASSRLRADAGQSVTSGLAEMAIGRALALAAAIPHSNAAPVRPLGRGLAAAGLVAAAVVAVAMLAPRLANTEWLRFIDPYGDHPPYSSVVFDVRPGNTSVLYGSGLDILVTTTGPPVERVDLKIRSRESGEEESLPMFPESSGHWRGVLTKVVSPGQYHVRAGRARSPRYAIDVITIPRLEQVRWRITPPAYTRQAPYEGKLPEGGLAGLPGTRVQVWAKSNRPLAGGDLSIAIDGSGGGAHALRPTSPGSPEVSGQFELTAPGKFELQVTDVDAHQLHEPFAGAITILHDDTPFVRILQPIAVSLATANATLPVLLSGEDDYGIARVELYRSLNESRALPVALPVANPPATRNDGSDSLPLASYGLEPGDVIKLFARIEDNDPSGAKGAESPIAEVRIISQEEYERLRRVKQGLNVLVSKYRQAQRRMAALADEEQGLRKKLKEESSRDPVSPETRQALKQLAANLRKQSDEVRKSTRQLLPYDIDKKLSKHLDEIAQRLQDEANGAAELADQGDLTDEQLAQWLDESIRQLAGQRDDFDRDAAKPLDYLEQLYPLLEDQSRFVALYQRQRDLAQRLASLKGHDGEDNPRLKIRMRELQNEQARLQDALGNLLDDIENHANRLPDLEELEELRASALKFADAVRASGALEAMGEAQTALAEFAGTRAQAAAEQAADLLEKFLSECSGLGETARGAMKFQPGLAQSLGATLDQLLGEAGLPTDARGPGADGYSMSRNMLDNMGLYGQMPGLEEELSGGGSGREGQWAGGRRGARGQSGQPTVVNAPGELRAAGAGSGSVPVQYRQKVGAYFQRIAEESQER